MKSNGSSNLLFGNKGISGSTLKIIAMISMLIDHCSLVFLGHVAKGIVTGPLTFTNCINSGNSYAIIYIVGRLIGRVAFLIFCFLLVQGFFYTKSRKKYLVRLLLFAFVSEVPFDLAFKNSICSFVYQNVFFTLAIGLTTIWLIEAAGNVIMRTASQRFELMYFSSIRIAISVIITLIFAMIAEALRTDYGSTGVITIVVIYAIYNLKRSKANEVCAMFAGTLVCIATNLLEISALIAVPLVALYNGKRGLKLKYVFYAFYPAHLLVLHLIRMLI